MKINRKLVVAFLLISVVPLAVASILAYFLAQRALREQVLHQLESTAVIQRNRIQAIIDQNLERLALVSSRTQLRMSLQSYIEDNDSAHQEKMNKILLDARSSIASFEDISILTLDGKIVASTNTAKIGTTHAEEEFFTVGQRENRADMFFLDEDNSVKLYLSGPLHVEEKIFGVVAIESKVDNIISAITDYSGLGETGETQLAKRDDNGDALFLTPLRFDMGAALTRIVSKDNLSAPITRTLLQEGSIITEAMDYRETPVLAATQYIEKPDWGLVVKIDKSEAFAPIIQLRNLLVLIYIVSSIAVILLSVYIARSITRPIVDLTRAATKISQGDLFQTAEVTSRDEIGTLTRAFNQMTKNLLEANTGLERQVEERTAELTRSNAELEDFTYVVSHDLKEPLRGIEAFSMFLAEDYDDKLDDKGQRYLTALRDSALRMRDLIEDLLQLSRIGRVRPEYATVAVESLLEDVQRDLQFALTEKGVELRIQSGLPTITCDASRIKQVFENLISNAIKFNDKPAPVVEIVYHLNDAFYTFSVRDNGIGIDEKYHNKIFGIFQRLGRREEYEGTGIGLTICGRIVEGHGGTIWVDSKVGQGSTFSFTIPATIQPNHQAKGEQNGRDDRAS